MDELDEIEAALKEFESDLAIRTQLSLASEASRSIHAQIAGYLRTLLDRERSRLPKKRDPGLMLITALKVSDAPEWARQVRAALQCRTIRQAAAVLGVSYTTMKRFKADLGNIEQKVVDGTWKK